MAEPLPRRWGHVQAVAAKAESLRPLLGEDADLLVVAAWLHDIGYAPDVQDTGFHPLDGARYLRRLDADPRLCGGDSGKPTGRNTGRAPRVDLTLARQGAFAACRHPR
jgi:putative nucleotidyltransferase with HDIG domain